MKNKKQLLYVVILSMILTASLMTIHHIWTKPLRNCIEDVQSGEANLQYDQAKKICKKIGNLKSVDTN